MIKYDKDWNTYWGSGVRLKRLYSKHGKECFRKELICYTSSREDMDSMELYYTVLEKSLGKANYNIILGTTFSGADPSIYLKRSETIARKTKARYDELILENKDEILDLYPRVGSIDKVSKIVGVPRPVIKRCLEESDTPPTSRKVLGHIVDDSTKEAIKLGLKKFHKTNGSSRQTTIKCSQCNSTFDRGMSSMSICSPKCKFIQRTGITEEVADEIRSKYVDDKMTITCIAKIFNVSRKSISDTLKNLEVEVRTTNSSRV